MDPQYWQQNFKRISKRVFISVNPAPEINADPKPCLRPKLNYFSLLNFFSFQIRPVVAGDEYADPGLYLPPCLRFIGEFPRHLHSISYIIHHGILPVPC
jgi:hypothetical protein